MTDASKIELLKAHFRKEGLCLCKSADTQYPVDGIREIETLAEVIALVADIQAVPEIDEWADCPTQPIPEKTLAALRAVS